MKNNMKVFSIIFAVSLCLGSCGGSVSESGTTTTPSFHTSGSLDESFGSKGIVTTPMGGGYALAIQDDGKIVVAGRVSHFSLVRYNTDGGVDATFGSGGIVTTPIGEYGANISALSIQKDGKIVAAGSSFNGSDYDFAVARYDKNGVLDANFGINGIVTTRTGLGSYGGCGNAVGIQSNGKIVVAGDFRNYIDNSDIALVRYDENGKLDPSFGSGGIVHTTTGSSYGAQAMIIQNDDKIVVATADTLARYVSTDGSLDVTFGNGGIIHNALGSTGSTARALAIQSDGKIVAAGYASSGSNYVFALARYTSGGSLDSAFGSGGIGTTVIGSKAFAYALVIQSDGKIVAGGSASSGSNSVFAFARYTNGGTIDSAFGSGGIVTTVIGSSAGAKALSIQSDGKILAGGSASSGSDSVFALARLWP